MSGIKRILVTGGAGFIGSHFVSMAANKGYSIVVLDALTYAGRRENILPTDAELVVGNICDADLPLQLLIKHEIQAIINFAAESHVDRSISGPYQFIQTNTLGTFNLLNSSLAYTKTLSVEEKKKFRFIQISTDEVYGSLLEEDSQRFHEKTPYAPNSPYSASKASADHLVRAWHHTYQLPAIITHCSNNYGPRQFLEKFIPTVIYNAIQHRPIPIYGDGKNIRDWIHVEDHCSGIMLALERGTPGLTYCFGGNSERRNLDIVTAICQHLDQLIPRQNKASYKDYMQFVTDRPGHDRRYAIDDSFAQKTLGFERKFTFEAGLLHTIKWYLDHPSFGI